MKSILIIKTSSLGDLFHALPAVHVLKKELRASITWVAADLYADLVGCFDDVDAVIPFPRREFWSRLLWFRSKLRQQRYDYIIDLQGLFKSGLICGLASGRRRIGPSFHREGSRIFYGAVAGERNKERHAVDECLDVVRYLGLPVPETPAFPVTFPKVTLEGGAPRVAMMPCSRWETKNWPPGRFIEAGRALAAAGATVYLVGTKEDKPVCHAIQAGIGHNAVNLAGKTRLIDLGGVLQQMDLVITVDSGPMHMAAAVGCPVLAVFGATDPKRTGPFGTHTVITHGGLSCQPCLSRDCLRQKQDIACLNDLPASRIVDAALGILSRRTPP